MIAFIHGMLLSRTDRSAIVLTSGGVGYELSLTAPALSRLPAEGEAVRLHVQTIVREDALDLYGFETYLERQTFALLISISNLGPKKALAILSVFNPDELRQAVVNEDVTGLTRVPGIGAKTARQILWDLKFKLKAEDLPFMAGAGVQPGARSVLADALAGLTNLGYGDGEARPVLEEVLKHEPDLDVSEALRKALKALAAKRA